MLRHPLFQQALPILQKIEQAGFQAYFVGGCVRDCLLNKEISDVDIATSAYPQEIKELFKKTIDVGIEHGTVMVLHQASSYEITTFRTESTYQDFRRPDKVMFVRSLEEDLKRRDFTINALAMDCNGKIYDFHNGQTDLKHRLIRAVGQANERFNEDALRMMRAIRFSGQLNFAIHEQTKQGIINNAPLLKKIAVERICIEFEKLMTSSYRQKGLKAFVETNLYRYCPGFEKAEKALRSIEKLNVEFAQDYQVWAVIAYSLNLSIEQAKQLFKCWKLANSTIDNALTLMAIFQFRCEEAWTKDKLFLIGGKLAMEGEYLCEALSIIPQQEDVLTMYNALPIHSDKDLAINGKNVMQLLNQQKGGKYVGDILYQIRQLVLDGKLKNERSCLENWLEQFKEHVT